MKIHIRNVGIGAFIVAVALLLTVELASGGRGGRGGGGGGVRGGGVSRPAGGVSRPAGGAVGGGVSRPAGGAIAGGGVSRPSTLPAINRSPSISNPIVSNPINRPAIQPGGGGLAGGLGPRDGPGIVSPPNLGISNLPTVGGGGIGGGRVDPGFGVRPPVGNIGGVGGIGGGNIGGGIGAGNIGGIGGGNIGGIGGIGGGNIGGIGGGIGNPGIGNLPGFGTGAPNLLPGLGQGAGNITSRPGDYLGRRQGNIQDRPTNIADRSQNLQNRLDQRQDYRDQRQDQRQNFLGERSEDWQNWHNDYYRQHDYWYHGSWCDHWGNDWNHMWSEHTAAMVLGTTMWGLNRMNYWFGYGTYYNPYYVEPLVFDNTTINYSEPMAAPPVQTVVAQPGTAAAGLPPGVTTEGMKYFEAARVAFYKENFKEALASVNKALASMPTDAVLHEFRALTLFSLSDYKAAAAALHPVLAVGPGWDWTTMSSLYPGNYTSHLRNLEKYVENNSKSVDAHFVLGYHYLTLGHTDSAATEFKEVLKLIPNDAVSAQILQMLGKSDQAPVVAVESVVKIDAAKLIGTWNAKRGDKATFEFTLDKEKNFTWTYQEGKTKQAVKGAYALDGNVLALEPDAGGVMVAEVSEPKDGAFVFRVVGAPKEDPGLTFKGK